MIRSKEILHEIKVKKAQGVPNTTLMKEYNITYAELQFILKGEEDDEKKWE